MDDSRNQSQVSPGARISAGDKPRMFALVHKHRKRSEGLKWPPYRLGSTALL